MKSSLVVGFRKPGPGEAVVPETVFCGQKMSKALAAFREAKASGEFQSIEVYRNPRPYRFWRGRDQEAGPRIYEMEAKDIPVPPEPPEDAEELTPEDIAALAELEVETSEQSEEPNEDFSPESDEDPSDLR